MTQRHVERSLDKWDWLKDLHASLHAKPCFADLVVIVSFDRQVPTTPGGPIDVKAGTNVTWTHPDDNELDHHWEARHLEKRAASLITLLPAIIDHEGMFDTECWVEIHPDRIQASVARSDMEASDSTFNLRFDRTEDGWRDRMFITAVSDMPFVDMAAASAGDMATALAETRWDTGGHAPIALAYDEENGEIVIELPLEAYPLVSTVPQDDTSED